MRFSNLKLNKIEKLPKTAGVYCFKDEKKILYIGKATNIKERVKNHFPSDSEGGRRMNILRARQPAYRDNLFINRVKKVGFIKTNSEIEALILEANLIKKYQPKYNVVWRDDKNYFFVGITKEDYPQVFITHQIKSLNTKYKILNTKFVGPFVDGGALKQTLKILRKVFPYRTCKNLPRHSCLWYQLKRCPAPCLLKSKVAKEIPLAKIKMKNECQQNVKNLKKILQGEKTQVLKDLKKEMKEVSSFQDYEKAAKVRNQIKALEKTLEHTKIFEFGEVQPSASWFYQRIEAYDISNIQGKEATGSMVTFCNGRADKNFYRRFKIKTIKRPNDVAMLKEILARRFEHPEWGWPDSILIDGGRAQFNAALEIKNQKSKKIKVMAIAKKRNELFIEGQKKPILLKSLPREIFNLILQLRDEAHRFARNYHHKLREVDFFLKS